MKKAILPRLFAAMTAAVVTVSLLDAVATMGQSPDSGAAAVAALRPALDRAPVSAS
jgi:hypothetical protein